METTLFEKHSDVCADNGIGMYYCGRRIGTQNHVYGPEIRTHFLIVLVEKGRAVLYKDQKETEFGEKDMLVMFPNEKIFYVAQSAWSIQWIGISGNGIEEIFRKLGVTGENPIFRPTRYSNISAIFSMLYDIDYSDSYYAKFKAQSLLYDFFAELFAEKSIKNTDVIASAVRIMTYNYDRALSIKDISDKFFLDASYFSRLFKKEMGMAPKKYLLRLRIQRASELLKNTDYKIGEISNAVGFDDPLYFSKMFYKATAQTPTEYRNQFKKSVPVE